MHFGLSDLRLSAAAGGTHVFLTLCSMLRVHDLILSPKQVFEVGITANLHLRKLGLN